MQNDKNSFYGPEFESKFHDSSWDTYLTSKKQWELTSIEMYRAERVYKSEKTLGGSKSYDEFLTLKKREEVAFKKMEIAHEEYRKNLANYCQEQISKQSTTSAEMQKEKT